MVDQIADDFERPTVLSVASGHLREADISCALERDRLGSWVALDVNTRSLQEVRRRYGMYCVKLEAATVRQILTGKKDLGRFEFIYSTGLYDYLRHSQAKRLTRRLFDKLTPGGHLLIANFLSGDDVFDRGYMESFMGWDLIFRNHNEILELASQIDQTKVEEVPLTVEEHFNIAFLRVTKRD